MTSIIYQTKPDRYLELNNDAWLFTQNGNTQVLSINEEISLLPLLPLLEISFHLFKQNLDDALANNGKKAGLFSDLPLSKLLQFAILSWSGYWMDCACNWCLDDDYNMDAALYATLNSIDLTDKKYPQNVRHKVSKAKARFCRENGITRTDNEETAKYRNIDNNNEATINEDN